MNKKMKKKTIATVIIIVFILLAGVGTVLTLTADASGSEQFGGLAGAPAGGPPSGGRPAGGGPPSGGAAQGGPSGGFPGMTMPGSTIGNESTAVEVSPVEIGTVQRSMRTNGDIVPVSEVDVYSDVSGKLMDYNVDLGQYVYTGAVIARVDPSKPGQSYSPNPVLSPIDGTISAISKTAGDTITTSTVIATVSDFENLRATASVPERYVGYIRLGMKASLTLEAYEDRNFVGSIVEISPMLNSSTRSLDIKLKISDPEKLVKAGMFADISLTLQESTNVLVVPLIALVSGSQGDAVYVVDEQNTARLVDVDLGLKGSSFVEITSGLNAGDLVVVKGQSFLSDGDSVRIITEAVEE